MSKNKKPPKWHEIYPHGTKQGDEELKFFISLARDPKYKWRSTAALAKETGLSKARVEEIIAKYYKKGMVFQSPKNEDHWGYWANVPEMLGDAQVSISSKDQSDRIDKVSASCVDIAVGDNLLADAKFVYYIDTSAVSSNKSDEFLNKIKESFKKKYTNYCLSKEETQLPDEKYFHHKFFNALDVPYTK